LQRNSSCKEKPTWSSSERTSISPSSMTQTGRRSTRSNNPWSLWSRHRMKRCWGSRRNMSPNLRWWGKPRTERCWRCDSNVRARFQSWPRTSTRNWKTWGLSLISWESDSLWKSGTRSTFERPSPRKRQTYQSSE
jgi:hypothetical protein